jgi:Mg-chelatase subunit ChlI
MTVRVYCPTCENMVHPTDPHSCFSAAAQRAHRDAERAVIEVAKLFAARPSLTTQHVLIGFVSTLRALEGDA